MIIICEAKEKGGDEVELASGYTEAFVLRQIANERYQLVRVFISYSEYAAVGVNDTDDMGAYVGERTESVLWEGSLENHNISFGADSSAAFSMNDQSGLDAEIERRVLERIRDTIFTTASAANEVMYSSFYTIQTGDTLSSIAARFSGGNLNIISNHPSNAFLRDASHKNGQMIFVGETIVIPNSLRLLTAEEEGGITDWIVDTWGWTRDKAIETVTWGYSTVANGVNKLKESLWSSESEINYTSNINSFELSQEYLNTLSETDKTTLLEIIDMGDLSNLPEGNQAILKELVKYNFSDDGKGLKKDSAIEWESVLVHTTGSLQCKGWLDAVIVPKINGEGLPNNDTLNIEKSYWLDDKYQIGEKIADESFKTFFDRVDAKAGDIVQIYGNSYGPHTFVVGKAEKNGMWVFDTNWGTNGEYLEANGGQVAEYLRNPNNESEFITVVQAEALGIESPQATHYYQYDNTTRYHFYEFDGQSAVLGDKLNSATIHRVAQADSN